MEIKDISVAPLEVEVERVQTPPQVAIPGLPPIPIDVLELEGRLAGLERTISSLRDGSHPSLRGGRAKLAEGERQWEQLKGELETYEIELPHKQDRVHGKFKKKSRNWLVEEVLAKPASSLAELCALVPELPPSVVLPYIHRIRNTELARRAFENARAVRGRSNQEDCRI